MSAPLNSATERAMQPKLLRSLDRALQGREPLAPVCPTFCSCITPPSNHSPATAEEVKRSRYFKKKGGAVDILDGTG